MNAGSCDRALGVLRDPNLVPTAATVRSDRATENEALTFRELPSDHRFQASERVVLELVFPATAQMAKI